LNGYLVVFSILLIVLIIDILSYFFPEIFIRFRGRKAVFSEKSKYDIFSKSTSQEFKEDVIKYKQNKKIEILIIVFIVIILIAVAIFGRLSTWEG